MILLRSMTILAISWLTCSSRAIPFIPASDLRTVVDTVFEKDPGPSLNMCDLMEIVKSKLCLESPHETEDMEKLKNSVEDMLASYLNGRQSRQAQVGYNINSFGLRFGKRGLK